MCSQLQQISPLQNPEKTALGPLDVDPSLDSRSDCQTRKALMLSVPVLGDEQASDESHLNNTYLTVNAKTDRLV